MPALCKHCSHTLCESLYDGLYETFCEILQRAADFACVFFTLDCAADVAGSSARDKRIAPMLQDVGKV